MSEELIAQVASSEDEEIVFAAIRSIDSAVKHDKVRLAGLCNTLALVVAMQDGISEEDHLNELRATRASLEDLNRKAQS